MTTARYVEAPGSCPSIGRRIVDFAGISGIEAAFAHLDETTGNQDPAVEKARGRVIPARVNESASGIGVSRSSHAET